MIQFTRRFYLLVLLIVFMITLDSYPESSPNLTSFEKYNIDHISKQQSTAIGRMKVFKNNEEITEKCILVFKNENGTRYKLDKTAMVYVILESGLMTLHHLECQGDDKKYAFNGVGFSLANAQDFATYFGDARIDLDESKSEVKNIQIVDEYNRTVGPFHRDFGKAKKFHYAQKLLSTIQVPKNQVQVITPIDLSTKKQVEVSKMIEVNNGLDDNLRSKIVQNTPENWYLYWSASYLLPNYKPASLQSLAESIKATANTSRLSIGTDLGFYLPFMKHKLILGLIGSYELDKLSNATQEVQMAAILGAASAQYYFGSRIGSGVFVRADLGMSKIEQKVSGFTSGNGSASTGFGLSYQAGLGYSYAVTIGTRLGFSLLYHSYSGALSSGGSVSLNGLKASIGLLF